MPQLDPDRRLALAYVPARVRPALEALWRLDVTFAAILAGGRERMVGRIKLAWWREALEALDRAPPPAEPLLQALAAQVLPAGVTGAELAAMEEGWAVLLSDAALTPEELDHYADARGARLFRYSAQLLRNSDFPVEQAGRLWALADLARHNSKAQEVPLPPPESRVHWPRKLRPLGMLATLAARDLDRGSNTWERQGSPGRMLCMIRHRLTGY